MAVTKAGSVTRGTLVVDTRLSPGVTVDLVRRTIVLGTGEKRHLRAQFKATSTTTGIVGLTQRIRCLNSSGATVSVVAASARNHEGSDTTTYATPGHLPLYADLLFTAPSAGTYTCVLQGTAYSSLPGSYHLTARSPTTPGSRRTTPTGPEHAGGRTRLAKVMTARVHAPTSVMERPAAMRGCSTTTGPRSTSGRRTRTRSASRAQANLELTTCYQGTASCAAAMEVYPRGKNAVVDARLELVQLDATGHTCRTNSTTARRTITDDAHHAVGYSSLTDVPIDPACGTRTFLLRIYVKHVSGQTVKIDGIQSGITSLTNGIAFNNFR